MKIFGVGTDIVKINRVQKLLRNKNIIEKLFNKEEIKKWKYSKNIFLTKPGEEREAPNEGEIFIQKDLRSC